MDDNNVPKNIYINIWPDNKDCPEEDKKECPNDADLIMITDAHMEHARGAPSLLMSGKIETRKILSNSEIGVSFELL